MNIVDALAHELAESAAKSDIESFCGWHEESGRNHGRWFDTESCDTDYEKEA